MKRGAEDGPGAENEQAAKRAAVEALEVCKYGEIAHRLPQYPAAGRAAAAAATGLAASCQAPVVLVPQLAALPEVLLQDDPAAKAVYEEQDEEVDDVGIPAGWRECPAMGKPVDRFIPFKVCACVWTDHGEGRGAHRCNTASSTMLLSEYPGISTAPLI